VVRLSSATAVIGPLVSSESVVLRNEYRTSLLNLAKPGDVVDLKKFVCEPLGFTAGPLGSGSELSEFGTAARTVAIAPRQRGWFDLISSLFQSYEIPPPRPVEAMKDVRSDAYASCESDVTGFRGVDAFLVDQVGHALPVAGGRTLDDAISGIIEVVQPAVLDALDTVDEHRRAQALREFFGDKQKVARLEDHIGVLKQFFSVMDRYRRLRAMEAVNKVAAPAWDPENTSRRQELAGLAARYDTVYALQLEQAFADMELSVHELADVASGKDEVALIYSASAATLHTIRAIEGIAELTEEGPQKKRLRTLVDQLTGHDGQAWRSGK